MMTLNTFIESCKNFRDDHADWLRLDSFQNYSAHESYPRGWYESCDNRDGGIDVSWAFKLTDEQIEKHAPQEYYEAFMNQVQQLYDENCDIEQFESAMEYWFDAPAWKLIARKAEEQKPAEKPVKTSTDTARQDGTANSKSEKAAIKDAIIAAIASSDALLISVKDVAAACGQKRLTSEQCRNIAWAVEKQCPRLRAVKLLPAGEFLSAQYHSLFESMHFADRSMTFAREGDSAFLPAVELNEEA
jgi:hypothetical protein